MNYINEILKTKGYADTDIDKKVKELEQFLKLRFDNPRISPPTYSNVISQKIQ